MSKIISLLFMCTLVGCSGLSTNEKSASDKKADIYYSQGTSDLIRKDYTAALVNLKKAHELNPTDSNILNNLGMAYYLKNDKNKAFEFIKKSIQIDPKNSDARNNLASILFSNAQLDQAKSQYMLVLKDLEYPHQFRTYYNLGLISFEQGNIDESLSYLKKSLSEKEDHCPALYQSGVIQYRKKDYLAALNSFQKASIGTCSNNPSSTYQQALCLISLQRPDQALLKFREILELFPNSTFAILAKKKMNSLEFNQIEAKL